MRKSFETFMMEFILAVNLPNIYESFFGNFFLKLWKKISEQKIVHDCCLFV